MKKKKKGKEKKEKKRNNVVASGVWTGSRPIAPACISVQAEVKGGGCTRWK